MRCNPLKGRCKTRATWKLDQGEGEPPRYLCSTHMPGVAAVVKDQSKWSPVVDKRKKKN